MYLQKVVLSSPPSQLSHCLDERPTLDISHCPTKFDNADIRLFVRVIHRYSRNARNPVLDCIREMRHDLYSTAKVVASSLPLDDVLVDLAGGDVVFSSQGDVKVPLVVAQVKVNFSAIIEDEHLPVPVDRSASLALVPPIRWMYILCGCHGPRIDIHIRVDLDRRNVRGLLALTLVLHALPHAYLEATYLQSNSLEQ